MKFNGLDVIVKNTKNTSKDVPTDKYMICKTDMATSFCEYFGLSF